MEVVEIDVVGAQALERAFDRRTNGGGRAVARLAAPAELRGEHDLVAPTVEDLAEEALAVAPVPVHLGGVEERDPDVQRGVDHGARGVEVDPAAEVVAAETRRARR